LRRAATVAVFLDIVTAFDNVIPSILVSNLCGRGLPAKLCEFTENLLCERRIFPVSNGILRKPLSIHKGIPQGSILSPILFNIYL